MPAPCHIREATPEDSGLILRFIRELAVYEKLAHEVVATEQVIRDSFFRPHATTHALIVEREGKPIGFAVYFYNFSTFLGRPGIYIEDIFIEPEQRGGGAGKQVLQYLAAKAKREGCGRLEWWVLDWNKPALDFYEKLGAVAMDEWTVYRVTGKALDELANTTQKEVA
jgi:GNAT superfamily N-acetyltransferase